MSAQPGGRAWPAGDTGTWHTVVPGRPGCEGVRHGRIRRPEGATGQDPNAVYALGSGPGESARLSVRLTS